MLCKNLDLKNGLGEILGDFFTNSSGHPGSEQHKIKAASFYQRNLRFWYFRPVDNRTPLTKKFVTPSKLQVQGDVLICSAIVDLYSGLDWKKTIFKFLF
jgi:hypothetical protein